MSPKTAERVDKDAQQEANRLENLFALGESDGQFTSGPPAAAAGHPGNLLRRAELHHFGGLRHASLIFNQRLTYIVGRNGAGKSTIPEAVLWGITGLYARGLDAGGRGTGALVQDGAAAMRVTLDLARAGEILRETNGTKTRLMMAETDGSPEVQQAKIYERLRTTAGLLRAVVHGTTLLDVGHVDAKELLMGAIDVRVPIGDERWTLAQIDARYKTAFEDRARVKKQRAELVVPPAPTEVPPGDIPALEAQLQQLRDEERALTASTASAAGERKALAARLEERQADQRRIEARIASCGDPHAALDDVEARLQLPSAAADPVDPEALAAETAERETLRTRLVDDRGYLKTLSDAVDAIQHHEPAKGCVLNADIPCKTPAKAFTGKLDAVTAQIAAIAQSVGEASRRIAELTEVADQRQRVAVEIAATRARLETERRQLNATIHNLEIERDRLTEVLAEIASTETAIKNCGEVAEDPALEELRARIAKGAALVPQARALAAAWETHRTAVASADALNRKVAALEQQVEQLGPKGARVAALEQALAGFTGRLNAALARFGFALAFELDPWIVKVNGRSAVRLSTSERLRVGICLQLALAEVTGLRLVIFDNTEWLVDPETREAFSALVFELAEGETHTQVLVLEARPDSWQAPAVPGMAVYRVRPDPAGGSSVLLEQDGAA